MSSSDAQMRASMPLLLSIASSCIAERAAVFETIPTTTDGITAKSIMHIRILD